MVSLTQKNLSQKEIRQRTPWLFAVLLLVNFAVMAYDARDAETKELTVRVWAQAIAGFVQRPVATVSNTMNGFVGTITQMQTAVGENQTLRERVNQLESEKISGQNLQAENERLKSLLGLTKSVSYQSVAAEVIARDPSIWFDLVTINRGSSSGIRVNMPVVTGDGVVGRIYSTSPVTSQVILLTNDQSAVGAIVGQVGASNAFGLIRGKKKEIVEMNHVSGQEKVEVGNIITTTGQDRIYPPGLKVGEVVEVKQGSISSSQTIFVRPTANLGSLREVAVLLYTPPTRPEPEQILPNAKKLGEKPKR
ncbi:MAG: rod shape-determining protein MreC [Acidobacteriota bacterium]|nr:rod shape-determining protein MreC [Acidobacteriota bacterium]